MELKENTKMCYILLDSVYQVKDSNANARAILLTELANGKTDFLKKEIESLNKITAKALVELGEYEIERNIPKKVKNPRVVKTLDFLGTWGYSEGDCPICGRFVEKGQSYCQSCGQKLKWEKEVKKNEN